MYFVCHFCLETFISNWKFVLFVFYQFRPFLLSMKFGTEIAGSFVKLARVCACFWGGANGLAGEFAGVKGSYLTALMLCILESFSARWIDLLRVALNSTNDALERRTSTCRWVITSKYSVGWLDEEWVKKHGRCHRDGFVIFITTKYPECTTISEWKKGLLTAWCYSYSVYQWGLMESC